MKRKKQNIIALVYDFDGTLSPNNIQEDTIFRDYKIDKNKFWAKTNELVVKKGYERTLAYIKLLIQDAPFKKNPLTKSKMAKLADQIEYFEGVDKFFGVMNRFMNSIPEVKKWGIRLEHYIVSSGMKDIMDSCTIAKHFKMIYGCEYEFIKGRPVFPKIVINDTNKTQFLFRINKGKLNINDDINSHMPESERRIPFRNMIYVGDGHTDIPSMTVTHKSGGHTIAIFPPKTKVPKEVRAMVQEKRADHFAPADYSEGELLVKILRLTLKKIIQTIVYRGSSQMSSDWFNGKRTASKRA